MIIISHRGLGFNKEQNTIEAFEKCFKNDYGIETDIRDYSGKLVVSHNIGNRDSPSVEDLFALAGGYPLCELAINIKADGIGELLCETLARHGMARYFTFDMSVPQMIEYRDIGITFFSRLSEYETSPVLLDSADGVWVDFFRADSWIDNDLVQGHLLSGKRVCIVSPELHKRGHMDFWHRLKEFEHDNLMLCTDYPTQADDFFNDGGLK